MDPARPALELAAALRAREFSAVELLDACLAAVDARNGELNAIVWRNDDQARAATTEADRRIAAGEARPFEGVPIPIKDLTEVQGWPVTFGSRGAPDGVSAESELVVRRLVDAGFVLCGRTNTPEFGHITATENLRFGITRNPHDTSRTPGGSSGGASAAVAGGMFPIAHATDGGGSIRIPAAFSGLVGLKPSRGRVAARVHAWHGAGVAGVVARTVADAAAVLDATSGPDPLAWYNAPAPLRPFLEEVGADPGSLRIGVMEQPPLDLPFDAACAEGARRAGETLAGLGHSVEPVEVPTFAAERGRNFAGMIAGQLGNYDGVDWTRVEPHVAHARAQAEATSSYEYVRKIGALERESRDVVAHWGRDFDLLVTPTTAILPPLAGHMLEQVHARPERPPLELVQTVAFTNFANITGLPAISLPLHTSADGLPVGVQLVGGPWGEAELLRVAAQLHA